MTDWNTTQVHFSIHDDIMDRLSKLAAREGRKEYELVRDSIVGYIQRREEETIQLSHGHVPTDEQNVVVGDTARVLEFDDLWTDSDQYINRIRAEEMELGSEIWALQYGSDFFDYYKWRPIDERMLLCRSHARFPLDVYNSIEERVMAHY